MSEQTDTAQVLRAEVSTEPLDVADAVWLVSSVRHAAPVRAVDGVERPIDRDFTAAMNEFLVGRTD